jgi:transposase InsO family protein
LTAISNAAAESFVDTFKTELISDRTWASRSQLELAIVRYVAWFNNTRLHEALDDRPPREVEELYAAQDRAWVRRLGLAPARRLEVAPLRVGCCVC